jgi:hypothetical protein
MSSLKLQLSDEFVVAILRDKRIQTCKITTSGACLGHDRIYSTSTRALTVVWGGSKYSRSTAEHILAGSLHQHDLAFLNPHGLTVSKESR